MVGGRRHRLDAVVGPSWSFISTAPAVADYPNISVPAGFDKRGRPIGLSMFARAWQDAKLLGTVRGAGSDPRDQPASRSSRRSSLTSSRRRAAYSNRSSAAASCISSSSVWMSLANSLCGSSASSCRTLSRSR
jgi:hypothetical protein